jgi:hypothetical protein
MPGSGQAGPDAWFLNQGDGKSFGPIPKVQLDGWVLQGLVGAGDFVLQQGDQQWRTARELYPLLGNASVAPADNAFPQLNTGGAFPQLKTGGSGGFSTSSSSKIKRPHRGPLILTLAIVGWMICGPVCIAAWVMGADDLKQMKSGRMDRSGETMTTFGMMIGMIGTILMVVGIVIAVPIFLLALGSIPQQ